MSVVSELSQWCRANSGVWSITQIAEAAGIARSSVGPAMNFLADLEPELLTKVQPGVYHIRVLASTPDPEPAQAAAPAEPTFDDILPDDEDLYSPMKIVIYDHFTSKNGDQWYRVRDEHGKRALFRYIDGA